MAVTRSGKVLIIVALALIALVIIGVFLPTIAAATVGPGLVVGAVGAQVNGTVGVQSVELGWGAPQRVRGLRITDETGREAANIDVSVASGLIGLLLSPDRYEVSIGGALRGSLRDDGSSSFQALIVESETPAAEEPAPTQASSSSVGRPALPAVHVDITDLRIALELEGGDSSGTIELTDVDGAIDFTPGGLLTVDVKSPTTSGGRDGRLALSLIADALVGRSGDVTPRGAKIDGTLHVETLPIPFDPRASELTRLDLGLETQDLADRLGVKLEADTVADGAKSLLRGDLVLDAPLTAEGSFNVGLGTIHGTVAGKDVPTALLQQVAAGYGLVLARDLGPTVDVDATFSPDADASGSAINVALSAEHASLDVAAAVTAGGAIAGGPLDARFIVRPELVAGLLGDDAGLVLERSAAVALHLDTFGIPAPDAEGAVALARIALAGRLELAGELHVSTGGAKPRRLVARNTRIDVSSAGLGETLRLAGGADVAGGRLEIDEQIAGLLDADDTIDVAAVQPVGVLALREMDGAAVAALLGLDADSAPGLPAAIADQLRTGTVSLEARTSRAGSDLRGLVSLGAPGVKAALDVTRGDEALRVSSLTAEVTVQPALVAALQTESADAITLMDAARASIALEPFDLPPGITDADGAMPNVPIRANIALTDTRLARGGAPAVVLSGLTGVVGASLRGDSDLLARGKAQLRGVESGAAMGSLDWDVTARKDGERLVPSGVVTVADLAVPAVEGLLDLTPDAINAWTGTPGTLAISFAEEGGAQRMTTDCRFPNLRGTAIASIDNEALTLEADALEITVRRTVLERRLNAAPDDAAATARIGVSADVPMALAIERCRLPLAAASGEPVPAGVFDVKATLTGGPLELTDATGALTTMNELTLKLESDDLRKGLGFAVTGAGTAKDVAEEGRIAIDGRLTDLFDDASIFSLDGAKLDMSASAEHVPTILADAALGMQRLLVAAVGVDMGSTFTAVGFSRSAGRVDGTITTPNADLTLALESAPGLLIAASDAPAFGSLEVTPPLREKLLQKIHPVLADIRATEDRLRFKLTGPTQVPVDGDVSKLNADVNITIGKVEFTAGSQTLGLLQLFTKNAQQTIPGSIEPVNVKIRNGIVTYDRFAVDIDKYRLLYQGRVDLVTETLDLRTEIPLAALGNTFKEVKGYVDGIVVPIVTRGSIDDPKTEIDPNFDFAGAAVESGIGGLIDEALKDKGVGDLLGDLFGGKKKKK